jgi:hypothetical protein
VHGDFHSQAIDDIFNKISKGLAPWKNPGIYVRNVVALLVVKHPSWFEANELSNKCMHHAGGAIHNGQETHSR